ncbi:alpha/beta-hydrolase [Cucurbitaria berberidis CBS 394.84]|uniref:Alpha/beta-hydrolase n=1 Tax=Cucurbitaria berberidis CBS 394.84 TaxID=1168544 RepID=A0A9P4L3C2_9PLEO|nr:alpha/beta-hydrolase [Cucurbitaria berberidis CBS 394.84]KAF1840215.1 alpha/beta-hydrolase [Cucurbitaria berberidis CBS 394.84]
MPSSASQGNLPPLPLPPGIHENYVHCHSNGLTFHILEAGYTSQRNKPLVILCHGFPELAFSWRKVMLPLAEAGYYVVAFDQRGYGRTTGWDNSSFINTNMAQFALTNVVRDVVTLVNALGYREVECIVGHDFGAVTASRSALMRPDLFKSVVMMSHPFKKAPATLPFNIAHGLHDFLRGYLHVKSAAWKENTPYPLKAWTADEVAKMPYYYVLPLNKTMPDTIADMMATEDASATKRWMSDEDLAVYVQEWSRTGFQGGLNYYRTTTDPALMKDLELFAGKKIECPSTFISGAQDWGNYQQPGAIEAFPESCSDFRGIKFIDGAGHWPQQEQPERVVEEILGFLKGL